MAWRGVSKDNHVYYTPPDLADVVVRLAKRVASPGSTFVDVGVGEGALFLRLPKPRVGVEVSSPGVRIPGVLYGQDVTKWSPSFAGKDVCVVMNPPFGIQTSIINACAKWTCKSLTVVWIAGAGVRMWHHEDSIDPFMHLVSEWGVPSWVKFRKPGGEQAKQISSVVQVWRRKGARRKLWSEQVFRPDPSVPGFKLDQHSGNVAVTITGNDCKVGKAGVVGRDVEITSQGAVLTPRGKAMIKRVVGPGCGVRVETGTLGTVRWASTGTAALLRTDNPSRLVEAFNSRVASGVFMQAFAYRGSAYRFVALTYSMLVRLMSKDWRKLIRPIKELPGLSRPTRKL